MTDKGAIALATILRQVAVSWLLLPCLLAGQNALASNTSLRIGSKVFTENIILAEIATMMAKHTDTPAKHIRQLGGTRVLWNALQSGEIDAYPEYTGTLFRELLTELNLHSMKDLIKALSKYGIGITAPFGFNNTYAVGTTRTLSRQLNLKKISDLRNFKHLKFGFTNEFMDRKEGWIGLRGAYNLPQKNVKGMNHDLAYKALETGGIDVMDFYSTDAEIAKYDLFTLVDDQQFFPKYDAVLLYRKSLAVELPELVTLWRSLGGKITADAMTRMNAEVKIDGKNESTVASEFLRRQFAIDEAAQKVSILGRLWRYTVAHLQLVSISLLAAIFLAIPLGIAAAKYLTFGKAILSFVGILQTIPSLALLVFMIPMVGIGAAPAILALFLYSLLPIVRNTHQGLIEIPESLIDSAKVMGLDAKTRLFWIELPLASGSILAGVKTAAVINIGTATLGALVGAGGYGQPILTGIRLDNTNLILLGAIPAAIMALTVEFFFDRLQKHWSTH